MQRRRAGPGHGKRRLKKRTSGNKKKLALAQQLRIVTAIMAFTFRKRIRLAKGLHLNFSKNGLSSISASPLRGLTFNTSSKGTRRTVSLPGTGMRWTSTSAQRRREPQRAPAPSFNPKLVALALIAALFLAGLNFLGQSEKPETIAQPSTAQMAHASQPAAESGS